MKSLLYAFGFVLAATASVATGEPILWSLPSTALQGCCIPPLNQQTATVSGTFLFDWQTLSYLDWSFDIAGYTSPLTPLNGTLDPATSQVVVGGPTFLHLEYASGQADLVLTFAFVTIGGLVEVPLPPPGGTAPVLVSNSARFVSFFSTAQPGVVSSVPEPVAGVLVLAGAVCLCLWKKVRSPARARG